MTTTLAPMIQAGEHRTTFESIDSRLRTWALDEGSDERNFPVLIAGDTLRRAEYPEAFPHLLMSAAVAADPAKPFGQQNAQLVDSFLSPAVCYHAYAQLAGLVLER